MPPSSMSDSDYVEDSVVDSDYNFDAESVSADSSFHYVARPDNTSTELRTKKYPAYNELLREARNVYGDDNPPFVSKLKGSASKDVVLPAGDGSYPAKLPPGSTMTLARRHWRGAFSFWTVEHEGQRFIVKGLSKTNPTRPGRWYRRWSGTKEGFGKEIFLVPYKDSFGGATNSTQTNKTSIPSAQKGSTLRTSSKIKKSGTAGTSHGRRSKQTSRTRSSASTAPKGQRPKVKPELADELETELEQLEAQEDDLEQELLRRCQKKLRKIQRRKKQLKQAMGR
ncbi:MAG: hypothetical protein LQ339_003314 [Xanthoria mediterranea]|nr:MAG: hypothetical protein LQ339_003314 [Xanthoria mediterranea]